MEILLTQEEIDSLLGHGNEERESKIDIDIKQVKEDIQDMIGIMCSSIENNKRCLKRLRELQTKFK